MNKERFQKLFQMTRMINSHFELDEIAKVLVDAIGTEIAAADFVGLFILNEKNTYDGYYGNNPRVDIKKLTIDPNEDLFAREIVTNKKIVHIPDTRLDPCLEETKAEMMKIESILGLPIILDGQVFGIVFIHDFGKKMELTIDQIELTEAFVNMTSVAIRNLQMFKQKQLLLDATNTLSKSLSSTDVLNTCFSFMEKATKAHGVAIHLYNESEGTIKPFHLSSSSHITEDEWKGVHKEEVNIHIDTDRLFHEVITTKKLVAVEDVFMDPRPNHDACRRFGIQSLLVIPLVANDRVFGNVAIPSIGSKREFTPGEIDLCQTIADVTATAFSNALSAENLDALVKERTAELEHANIQLEELVKELRYVDERKNDFIASLSHELRTPITAVKGSIDILKKNLVGEMNPAQNELVEISDKSIDRLLALVNEFLDFAKLEKGTFDITLEEVPVPDLIEEAARVMKPLFDRKKQHLEVSIQNQTTLKLDRKRMLQLLMNLLSNAHKFTDESGVISVKTYASDQTFFIEVEDNGIGISDENQKHIFTKFYQVNKHVNGTGLGLAISKQLVELHGGRLSFNSVEGKGSQFLISLPL